MHVQSTILAFAFHSYILWYHMILLVDGEGPHQTANVHAYLGFRCPHIPEDWVFAWHGPKDNDKSKGVWWWKIQPSSKLNRFSKTINNKTCQVAVIKSMAPDKVIFFFYQKVLILFLYLHENTEVLLMSTQIICFYGKMKENIMLIPSLIWSYAKGIFR